MARGLIAWERVTLFPHEAHTRRKNKWVGVFRCGIEGSKAVIKMNGEDESV